LVEEGYLLEEDVERIAAYSATRFEELSRLPLPVSP